MIIAGIYSFNIRVSPRRASALLVRLADNLFND